LRERLVKTKDKSKKLRNAVTKSRLGGDKSEEWKVNSLESWAQSVEPRSDSDEVPRSGRWAYRCEMWEV